MDEASVGLNLFCRFTRVNTVVEVPLDLERIRRIKQRFLTLATVMRMDEFLSGWFQGVPAEQIKRRNVEDFVAYGFYCRKMEQLSPEVLLEICAAICAVHPQILFYGGRAWGKHVSHLQMRQAVCQFVRQVEEAFGGRLKDGWNPNISFMAHMWEPLRYVSGTATIIKSTSPGRSR